jgi:hypothetical protein
VNGGWKQTADTLLLLPGYEDVFQGQHRLSLTTSQGITGPWGTSGDTVCLLHVAWAQVGVVETEPGHSITVVALVSQSLSFLG